MKKIKKIKLVFGTGNAGPQYENTRHNFGRDLIGALITNPKTLREGAYEKVGRLVFGYSLGFVNESGQAMTELVKVLKVKPEEILIIHDEADLPLFRLKFSFGKSAAGHKGVESIRRALKTYNFWRLRIGIQGKLGQAPQKIKHQPAMDLVLKKLTGDDLKQWEYIKKKKLAGLVEQLIERTPDKLNIPALYFLSR